MSFPILLVSEPFNAPADGYQFDLSSLKTPPVLINRFHSDSVTFPFFKGRHASPPPLKIPCPVIAILTASVAEIGDWHLAASTPSNEATFKGYCDLSFVKITSAPLAVLSSTLLCITIGPVNQRPAGICTIPPPDLFAATMALLIATVFNVIPSFTAP